jgi:CHAT domain-containing protein
MAKSAVDAQEDGLRFYQSGRVDDSIKTFEDQLDQSRTPEDQATWLSWLITICAEAREFACLERNVPRMIGLAAQHKELAPRLRDLMSYGAATDRMMAHDFAFFEKSFPPDFANRYSNPFANATHYIDLHVVAAQLERLESRYRDSQASIARALGQILLLPRDSRWLAARSLMRLIRLIDANGDVPRAWAWLVVSDGFIRANLVPGSPEYAEYLETVAFLAPNQNVKLGEAALQAAASAIEKLQIDEDTKRDRLATLYAHLAAVRAATQDVQGAKQALALHPAAAARAAIIGRHRFSSWAEFIYAVAEVYVAFLAREPPDVAWLPAFEAEQEWSWPGEPAVEATAYSRFAAALIQARANRSEATASLRAAARLRIDAFSSVLGGSWDASPLASDIDHLVLGLLLPELASSLDHDREAADLLLQSAEILNRSLRSVDADSLSIVAAQPSDETRRLAHLALGLAGRQREWELRHLRDFVARMSSTGSPSGAAQTPDEKTVTVRQLAELVHLRQRLDGTLAAKSSYEASRGRLPTLAEAQAALRDDEAFVTQVWTYGGLMRICIRQDRIWASAVQVNTAQLSQDVRLLQAALTATYPPSDTLDRQFPVAASVRLYAVLIGGLEACLGQGTQVFYAPSPDFVGLPLAALLAEPPPAAGAGLYDLSAAKWAALAYDFSYVPSLKGFLAARQAADRAGGDLAYLGVGAPALGPANSTVAEGVPASTDGAVASFASQLGKPGELPDARGELAAAAGSFSDGSATLLLGAAATEEAIRLQPLSRFNVIQFATHGLVGGDIAGLSEAALVLTPTPGGDQFDDGLLTASEIGTLALNARLVILSACDSANFDLELFGHAVQGLTSALALSGVPTVIASLWPVDSPTSRRLMDRFLRTATGRDGMSMAQAFGLALRQTIRESPAAPYFHPRFWAPFIVLGDGGALIRRPGAATSLARSSSPPDRSGLGEIMSVAAMGEGGLFASSEIGPYDGRRSSSLVKAWSLDGKSGWTIESRRIGAGALATGPDAVFATGYDSGEKAAGILRSFTPQGVLRWEQRFSLGADLNYISDIAVADDGSIVVAVAPQNFHGSREPATAALFMVDGSGEIRGSVQFPYEGGNGGIGVKPLVLALRGDQILVAMNMEQQPDNKLAGVDDFHQPVVCWKAPPARIAVFTRRSLAELRESAFPPGLEIAALRPHAAEVLAAGAMRFPCALGRLATAGAIDPTSLSFQAFWKDDSALDSWATGIEGVGDQIWVSGNAQSPFAIDEERREGPWRPPDAGQSRYASERYQREQPFVAEFVGGTLIRRVYADAGLSANFAGIVQAADGALLYGSVGFSPYWMELRSSPEQGRPAR